MPERDSGWVTATVSAEDARLATGALTHAGLGPVQARTGIRPAPGDPGSVEPTTTESGRVTVRPFQAVIQGTRATAAGSYLATLDAEKTVDVLGQAPADPSQPRVDRIVAVQTDTEYGDQATALEVKLLVGTPSAQDPSPAPLTGDVLLLAEIRVGAGVPVITAGDIRDQRVFTAASGGIVPVRGSSQRPQVPYEGQVVYRSDGPGPGLAEVWDGSGWAPLARGGIELYGPYDSGWPQIRTTPVSGPVTICKVLVPAVGYPRRLQVTGVAMLARSVDSERFDVSLRLNGTRYGVFVVQKGGGDTFASGSPTTVYHQGSGEPVEVELQVECTGQAGSAEAGFKLPYTAITVLAVPD